MKESLSKKHQKLEIIIDKLKHMKKFNSIKATIFLLFIIYVNIDRDGFIEVIFNGYWLKNPGGDEVKTRTEHSFAPKWYYQNTGSWMDNNVG